MYIVQSKLKKLIKSLDKRSKHSFLLHLDGKIEAYIRSVAGSLGTSRKTLTREDAIAFDELRKLSF